MTPARQEKLTFRLFWAVALPLLALFWVSVVMGLLRAFA